jgi:hypothetical protein
MANTKQRQAQRRGWLVRMDPDFYVDMSFGRHCDRRARFAYIDSLFYLASTDGPDGIYPFVELAREFSIGAESVAAQLVSIGAWDDLALGFRVHPRAGCRVVADGRIPVPSWLRQAVFDRDGHACVECGATKDLALDHIYPWSLGGPDTFENLRVLCKPCNSSKGATV